LWLLYLFDSHAEPALYNLLDESDAWNAFQAKAFIHGGQKWKLDTNPEDAAYPGWSQQPAIKAFCDDFKSRFCCGAVPGGRVADVWRTIYAFMQANGGHQQLHFETVTADEDCTVDGSVFQDGVLHNAKISFSQGDTVCVCVFVFLLFLTHCFRRCSFAKGF
jgi:hypothetical protein